MTNREKSMTRLSQESDHRFKAERSVLDVRGSAARRLLAVVGVPLLAFAISVFALGGIASAHVVTSITADCYQVTAHFSDFPDTGVMVHLAADVNGQTVSNDVLVTSATTEAHLDISAVTAALVGTPANIDVDVTWTYLGPQHAHHSLVLTCGTSTIASSTTTVAAESATTTTAVSPTTTTQATATTTGPQTTTTTEVHGTTIHVTTTTAPATTTTATVRRQGTTVVATTTTVPGVATLPRTGSDSAFPLMFGLSSLIAGALLLLRRSGASGPTDQDWSSAT
jgi:LPXTG-motif cell wall-anchored protein